jgi:hypothetical protein
MAPIDENQSTWKKSFVRVTFSTTCPIWIGLGSYLDLCGQMPATNRLGTDLFSGFLEFKFCVNNVSQLGSKATAETIFLRHTVMPLTRQCSS